MERKAAVELEETFRCWMCGVERSVLDEVIGMGDARLCGICYEAARACSIDDPFGHVVGRLQTRL